MIIDARFNGPPDSANGGYIAGLVSGRLTPPPDRPVAQVTLRRPPPLATPLRVSGAGERLEVYAGEDLVLTAEAAVAVDAVPPPVPPAAARAAAAEYPGFADHPFPTCYVCGPDRAAGDGLRIFPGPVPGDRPLTAAPWTVPPEAGPETVWAALDCPGGWAILSAGRPYLLGRIAVEASALPPAGTECVVVGELVATEGRKAQVRSAVYGPEDRLLAVARATWIAV